MALTKSEVFSVIYGRCRMDVEDGWKLIKVEEGFTKLTGYTTESIVKGRVVYSQLVHPDDSADFFQRWALQLETNNIAFLCHRLLTRDGQEVPVYCFGELFVDDATGRTWARATIIPIDENAAAHKEAVLKARS